MNKIEELLEEACEKCPSCDGTGNSWCTCDGGKVLSEGGVKLLEFLTGYLQTSRIGKENLRIEMRW